MFTTSTSARPVEAAERPLGETHDCAKADATNIERTAAAKGSEGTCMADREVQYLLAERDLSVAFSNTRYVRNVQRCGGGQDEQRGELYWLASRQVDIESCFRRFSLRSGDGAELFSHREHPY